MLSTSDMPFYSHLANKLYETKEYNCINIKQIQIHKCIILLLSVYANLHRPTVSTNIVCDADTYMYKTTFGLQRFHHNIDCRTNKRTSTSV